MVLHPCRRHEPRRGNVLPLVAICLVLMMTITAIGLDGGLMFAEHRTARGVADAAALAAAADLYHHFYVDSGTDASGTARASAFATAAANGYANDGANSSVTVNIPPQSGRFVGLRGYAEVLVTHYRSRAFSRVLGNDSLQVKARAVARGGAVAADMGILVLDPTEKAALNAQGGGQVVVEGAPVFVNSSHPEAAAKASGSGSMTAPDFYVYGGYTETGNGEFDGIMHLGWPPTPDPLATLPAPSKASLPTQSNNKLQYSNGSHNLLPGVYQGGIKASGTASINLAPGIYYVDGGGFEFAGQGSLVGNGVMIYNGMGNSSSGISITGQGTVELSGPTSGTYKNVTIFQDRAMTTTVHVEGNGYTEITGTFYVPNALLQIHGNGGMDNLGSQYISRKLDLAGNGNLYVTWHPDKVAPGRTIYLVE